METSCENSKIQPPQTLEIELWLQWGLNYHLFSIIPKSHKNRDLYLETFLALLAPQIDKKRFPVKNADLHGRVGILMDFH